MNKICLIYNFAHHYRTNIFMLMDQNLSCDFVFGDKLGDIKKMDYSLLKNFKKEVKNIVIYKPIYYQKGVLSLLFEKYSKYIMLGESICISTWIFLFLAKIMRKKVYIWTHGWYGKESKLRILTKRIFISRTEGVFLYGNYAKQLMIEKGIPEQKLHVIYNSLAYDQQILLRKNLKESAIYKEQFKNNSYNLIFIGRLTPVKKLNMLLEAVAVLNSKERRYNLTFIGDGIEKENLLSITKQLNLQEVVWFYGASYNEEELSNLIYNADLCISPGNVGLTAMHAMTYGTPVVSHNKFSLQMPEFEAIEKDRTGDFFEYENLDSLIHCIQNWFQNNYNRENIREACYEVIDSKYNPHIQLEVLKKVLC